MTEEFTMRDGLAWLGLSWEDYEKSAKILEGRHGSPFARALLDAREAQGTDTTAAEVLARHGINPERPLDSVRRFNRNRSKYDGEG